MTTNRTPEGDALFAAGYRITPAVEMHCFIVVNPANARYKVNPLSRECSCKAGANGRPCKHVKHWNALCDAQLNHWDFLMAKEREAAVAARKPWQTESDIRQMHARGFGSEQFCKYLVAYGDLYLRAEECVLDAERYGEMRKAA